MRDVVGHAQECVAFWRKILVEAEALGVKNLKLDIAGVVDIVEGLLAEIAADRLESNRKFMQILLEKDLLERHIAKLESNGFNG